MIVSWTSLASGTQALPTDDSELYSLAHNNEPVLSTVTRCKRKSSFDLKRFNKALHTDALVAICSSLRDLGTQRLLACVYLNDHVRLLKRYHVKCLMPALFLPPEFAHQSIPDPELPYTFHRQWHPVGVQPWLHLLKMFYCVWIPLPRIKPEHKMVQKTPKHRLTRRVFPCLFYLLNTSTELQHSTQL